MCTVTFIPGRKGYRLGMNRDEQRSRAKGRPPERAEKNGSVLLSPSEPGGGTWIGLNDRGVTLALINWYSVNRRATKQPVSRGEIIPAARAARSPEEVVAALRALPLRRINPFRLIGVFPAAKLIVEWCWDLEKLVARRHPWTAQQWISSGFDEPKAQRVRGATFRLAKRQASFGRLDWLRRLHRSHAPEPGPFSTCMHRSDAVSVSYTEVSVMGSRGAMVYHEGPPCGGEPVVSELNS